MKIIFIGRYNPSELLNGPEKFAKRISQLACSRYEDIIFIQYFFEGYKYGIFKKLFGYEENKIDTNLTILRLGIFQIFFRVLKFKPQIIHILMFERFATEIFLINLILRAKIIYTVHSIFYYENKRSVINASKLFLLKNRICEYLLLNYSDKIVFVSDETINLAKKYYEIDEGKTTVIHQGIDPEFYEANKKFQLSFPIKIIFYNGINSGIDRKLNELIKVLEEINDPPIQLFIIGENFTSQLKSTNIQLIQVDPLPTDKLHDFFSDKHIFLKSPVFDSFSIMSLEAMASGLICIVSNFTGMQFIIKNEINGFIYNKDDLNSLLQKLTKVIRNDYDLKQISKKATEIYFNYGWDKVFENYSGLYCQIFFENKKNIHGS